MSSGPGRRVRPRPMSSSSSRSSGMLMNNTGRRSIGLRMLDSRVSNMKTAGTG